MYLAIIMLPLLSGVIIGLLGRKLGTYGSRLIGTVSIIICTILSIVGYYEIAISESPLSIYLLDWIDTEYLEISWSLNIDSLSISIYIPVLIVSTCVHIYSIEYMSGDAHNPRFFSYLSLFTFFMLLLISGDNLLLIFIGWEGVGVCSYLLVNFWFKRIQANKAAMKAIMVNRIGDWGLTLGMILMWWVFGNLELSTIFSLAPLINVDLITMIAILVLLGAMAKSAQIGLHTWLPDAMEGPTPVSALIHAATMVTAGVYLLIRLSPLIEYSTTGLLIISWVGGLTAIFAATTAIFQNDLKRVIAYSTCSQLGYMVLAVGLSQYTLSVFHLVNHAYFKALLFLSAGAVIHSFSDEQDMRKYGGLINILPFTYISILIGSLSLLAIPYLTGFYSKDLILEVAYGQYEFQGSVGYWLGTITACITSFYSFRLIYLTFISYPNGVKYNYSHAHEPSIIMTIPLVILGLFSIFHGYFAYDLFIGLGSGLWGNSIYISPDHVSTIEGEFSIPLYIKLLPFFGSLFSIALGTYIYNNLSIIGDKGIKKVIYRFLNKRYHIDNIYNSLIVSNVFNLAYITSKKLDKGVLELIGVTALVKLVNENSSKLASFDNGYIPHLALNVIIGYILVLGGVEYLPGEEIILILILMMILSNKTEKNPSFTSIKTFSLHNQRRSYSTKPEPEKKNMVDKSKKQTIWMKIKSQYNNLNNKFIKWTESPYFTLQFAFLFGFFGLIHSLYNQGFFSYLISKIQCMDELDEKTYEEDSKPVIYDQETKDKMISDIDGGYAWMTGMNAGVGIYGGGKILSGNKAEQAAGAIIVGVSATTQLLIETGKSELKKGVNNIPTEEPIDRPLSPSIYDNEDISNILTKENMLPGWHQILEYINSLDNEYKLIICIISYLIFAYLSFRLILIKNTLNLKSDQKIEKYLGSWNIKPLLTIKKFFNKYSNFLLYTIIIWCLIGIFISLLILIKFYL